MQVGFNLILAGFVYAYEHSLTDHAREMVVAEGQVRDQSTKLLPLKATLQVLCVELLEPEEVNVTLSQRWDLTREEVNHLETFGIMSELTCSHINVRVAPHYVRYCKYQWLEWRISITGTHLLAFLTHSLR